MKQVLNKVVALATSRVVRNIVFWIVVYCYTASFAPQPVYHVFAAVLELLLMGAAYINTLVLVPKFVAHKKYGAYLLWMLPITYLFAVGYTWVLKFMIQTGLNPWFSNVVLAYNESTSGNMSMGSVVKESVPAYYGVFLVLICIFNMIWYVGMADRQQKIIEQERLQRTVAELTFLKSQIHPHFLFNTLNNLYGLILTGADEAKNVVLQLSALLRYLLYESDVPKVDFEKEKEIMESYIELELLRLKDINNISLSVRADRQYQIPPLLWVPVLENVFKHRAKADSGEQFIDFRFTITNGELSIYSKNSVRGVAGEARKPGIGLENLRKRLALIYPGKHHINTVRGDNNFLTEIKIEL